MCVCVCVFGVGTLYEGGGRKGQDREVLRPRENFLRHAPP